MPSLIRAFVPYYPGDLGRAYNEAMGSLGPDDWGCLLDHDAMFGHPQWYDLIDKVKDDYGLLVPVTNRIGCRWQRDPLAWKLDSLSALRERADFFLHTHGTDVEDVTNKTVSDDLPGGVCLITSRRVCSEVGGFKSGILGVDNDYFNKVVRAGYKVGLIRGLYVIHWYRGGNQSDKSHLVHGIAGRV